MSDVVVAWGNLVRWLEENAPVNRAALSGPATQEEISAAERTIGVEFPQDLKDLLLSNNGVRYEDGMGVRLSPHVDGYFLTRQWVPLSLDLIVRVYQDQVFMRKEDPGAWSVRWIPFAAEDDAAMYGYFIDAESGEIGTWGDYGQLSPAVHPSMSECFDAELSDLRNYVENHYGDLITIEDGKIHYH